MTINEFPNEMIHAVLEYLPLEEQWAAAASCTKFKACCEKRTAEIEKMNTFAQTIINRAEGQKLDPRRVKEIYKKMQVFATNSELINFLNGFGIDPKQLPIIDIGNRDEPSSFIDKVCTTPEGEFVGSYQIGLIEPYELGDVPLARGVTPSGHPFIAFSVPLSAYGEVQKAHFLINYGITSDKMVITMRLPTGEQHSEDQVFQVTNLNNVKFRYGLVSNMKDGHIENTIKAKWEQFKQQQANSSEI